MHTCTRDIHGIQTNRELSTIFFPPNRHVKYSKSIFQPGSFTLLFMLHTIRSYVLCVCMYLCIYLSTNVYYDSIANISANMYTQRKSRTEKSKSYLYLLHFLFWYGCFALLCVAIYLVFACVNVMLLQNKEMQKKEGSLNIAAQIIGFFFFSSSSSSFFFFLEFSRMNKETRRSRCLLRFYILENVCIHFSRIKSHPLLFVRTMNIFKTKVILCAKL